MARLPRLAVAGQPHLVIQRARAGMAVFVDDTDRELYLKTLIGAARSSRVALHAYALVDDAVLLLVTPATSDALGRCMQRVGRGYVPAFNRRHGRQGTLWAGRFDATAVEPERYLLSSIRFVEQAPVRSGVATSALDWPWSSAAHHVGRRTSPWITEHPAYWRIGNTPFEREARHDAELRNPLSDSQIAELRDATRRGWPLGSAAFVAAIGQTTPRPMQPRPRGRPRRAARLETED
jgi:putative transposase